MAEVSVIPDLEDKRGELKWSPTKTQEKRGKRIHTRIDNFLNHRAPFENSIRRSLALYEGTHPVQSPKNSVRQKNDEVVAPFARVFVETKTAEEIKVFSDYKIVPVEDAGDSWKVELLREVNNHVRRVVKMKPKKQQLLRMKNIAGVSIARIGYRRIMGLRKIRTGTNEHGDLIEWQEVPVPVYDDLFLDVISPLNFAVDPNATTMDDAMDCVHFHAENFEVFWETYANDERFKNVDKVQPGRHGRFTEKGFTEGNFRSQQAKENMVLVAEYFNRIRDEWVVYANGVEIYYGPLPDDHKELPFVSYHNHPSFERSKPGQATRLTDSGEEVSRDSGVVAEETFWTIGDPEVLRDLIVLRTEHGRAAHRAHKLAGQTIIATKGEFQFDESRPWRAGDQAKGAMGKFDVVPLGRGDGGNWQFVFEDLTQQMILASGIDPRNLTETKTKTATEASIQRETSMRRLEENIEYNEENAEVRLGKLIHQLIQQRYTKPEIVRLLGDESEEDLKRFDSFKESEDGTKVSGLRFRRIPTDKPMSEKSGNMKEDDTGVNSFIAKPEYIRTSNVDIQITTQRRAGEVQSIELGKATEALQIMVQLLPLAQPDPTTGKSILDVEDLPNVRLMVEKMVKALGLDPEKAIGQTVSKKSREEEDAEALLEMENTRQPLV